MKKLLRNFIAGMLAFGAVSALSAQARQIDVWDFGGVEEEGAKNHISISDIEGIEQLGADGKFSGNFELTYGDLTVKIGDKDRAYNSSKKNYGSQGFAQSDFDDGYISDGVWYCNGKGGEQNRCVILRNVKAGDVVTFYAQTSNAAEEKIHFASLDETGLRNDIQDEVAPISKSATRYSYIAITSGQYKIYFEASSGKPVYFRVVRTRGVEVNGSLTSLPAGTPSLKFIVKETNQELFAKVTGKSYSVALPSGHTYTAVLDGISGYGISPLSKVLVIDEKSAVSIKKDLAVSEKRSFVVSGKISGFLAGYLTQNGTKLVLTPPAKSAYLPVESEIKTGCANYALFPLILPRTCGS